MKVYIQDEGMRKVRRIPHWPHRYKRWEYVGGNYAERWCETCGHCKRRKVYLF